MWDEHSGVLCQDLFENFLELECKRALRYQYFFSVFMIEMDQTGNEEFVSALVSTVRKAVRKTDLIGTCGLQSVSILLPVVEAPETYRIGERIRHQVEHYNFRVRNRLHRRTVSVGGACFPTHAADAQYLLSTAGEMLLGAKSVGGNMVCLPQGEVFSNYSYFLE